MGFQTGTTAADGVSEEQRCAALGRAMDLNCLCWILLTCASSQDIWREWLQTKSLVSLQLYARAGANAN